MAHSGTHAGESGLQLLWDQRKRSVHHCGYSRRKDAACAHSALQVSRVKNIRNLFPDQNTGTPHPELLKPVDGLAAVTEAFRTLKESKSALHSCEQAR